MYARRRWYRKCPTAITNRQVTAMATILYRVVFSLTCTLVFVTQLVAQASPAPVDQWAAVRFLLGSWEGTSTGQAGNATVRREYRFVLREQFIEERHTSTYPP